MTDSHIKINDTEPRISHVADGVATEFAVPFPFLGEADLKVWRDDIELVLGDDFTVSGAGETQGGAVTFSLPPADGMTITLARQQGIARSSDFLAGSALRAAALNTELDRLTMIGQELEAADRRSLRAPAYEASEMPPLPGQVSRAGRLLSFDSDGAPEIGPPRASVDLVEAITGAEAGAVAAATSAEAAAAAVAAQVAAVDIAELQANHQAAVHSGSPKAPVSFQGVPMLAHLRPERVFLPDGNTLRHQYRAQDSGVWLMNGSATGELWVDASMLDIGQQLCVAVRDSGTGDSSAIVDPGVNQLGAANTIRPFAAGEKIRVRHGETIVLTATSGSSDGGIIIDVLAYRFNPIVIANGAGSRMVENALGLFDGHSIHNQISGMSDLVVPTGFMTATDAVHRNFSFPLFQAAFNADGTVSMPRLKLPDREYSVTMTQGSFAMGDVVTASGGGTLKVEYLCHDTSRLGLDLTATPLPVTGETLTGPGGTPAQGTIDGISLISDIPPGATSLTVHNPNASTIDLRAAWFNLEKI